MTLFAHLFKEQSNLTDEPQELIHNAGVEGKAGWAFGIGIERLAMMLYKVPDIRCFWSEDPGFKNQFVTDDVEAQIIYKVFERIILPPKMYRDRLMLMLQVA